MNIPIEKKKQEAIERMKIIGIYPDTIKQFEKDNLVSISESPIGAYYWADEKSKQYIKKLEEVNNLLVYTGIRSFTDIGILDSFLYISDYEEEWENDREMLKEKQTIAFVRNHEWDDCSEFGSIGFKLTPALGLLRIW